MIMIVPYTLVVIVATSFWMGVVLTEENDTGKNVKTNIRHVRQTSNADQMVQNILRWLQGVYSQQSRRIRQGTFKEYLPPTNTQKPRPFGHPSGDGVDDQGNFVDSGYPPAGSITPQPPFPIYTTGKVTGYPSVTYPPAQETITPERPGYNIKTSTVGEFPTHPPSYTSGPTSESTERPSQPPTVTEFSGYPTRPSTIPQEFPTQPSYQPPKVTGYPSGPSTVPEEISTQPPHVTLFPGYPSGPSTVPQEISTQPPYQPTKVTGYPTDKPEYQPSPEITTVVYTTYDSGLTSQQTPETDESTSPPPITITPEVPTSTSETSFPNTTPKTHDVTLSSVTTTMSDEKNATIPLEITQRTTQLTNTEKPDVSTQHPGYAVDTPEAPFTTPERAALTTEKTSTFTSVPDSSTHSELSSTISEFTTYLYGTNREDNVTSEKSATTDSIINTGTSELPGTISESTGYSYLPPEKPFTLPEKTISESPDVTTKRLFDDVPGILDVTTKLPSLYFPEITSTTPELPGMQRVTSEHPDVRESHDITTKSSSVVVAEITDMPPEFPDLPSSEQPNFPKSTDVTSKIPIDTEKPDSKTEFPDLSIVTSEQPRVLESSDKTTKVSPIFIVPEIAGYTPEFPGLSLTTTEQTGIPQSSNLTTKVPSVVSPEIPEFTPEFPGLSVTISEQPGISEIPDLTTKIPPVNVPEIPGYTSEFPGFSDTTSEQPSIPQSSDLTTKVPSVVVPEIPGFTPEFPGLSVTTSEQPDIPESPDLTTKVGPPGFVSELPGATSKRPGSVPDSTGYQYFTPEIPFTLPERTISEKPDLTTKLPSTVVVALPGTKPELPGSPELQDNLETPDVTTNTPSFFIPEKTDSTPEFPDFQGVTSDHPANPEKPDATTNVPSVPEIPYSTPISQGLPDATPKQPDTPVRPDITTKLPYIVVSEISHTIPEFPGYPLVTSELPNIITEVPKADVPENPDISPEVTTEVPAVFVSEIPEFPGTSVVIPEQPAVPEIPDIQGSPIVPSEQPGKSASPDLTTHVPSERPGPPDYADLTTKVPIVIVPDTSSTTSEFPGYSFGIPEKPGFPENPVETTKVPTGISTDLQFTTSELPSVPVVTSKQPSETETSEITTTRKYPVYTEKHAITTDNEVLSYQPTTTISGNEPGFPTHHISDITTLTNEELPEITEESKIPTSITSETLSFTISTRISTQPPSDVTPDVTKLPILYTESTTVTSDKPGPDIPTFISTARSLSPDSTNLPTGITQQFPDKSLATTETVTGASPEGVSPETPGSAPQQPGFPTRAPPSPSPEEPAYTTRPQTGIIPGEGTTSRPTYTSPTTLPTTPEAPGEAVPTGAGPEEDLKHPPHIHAIEVQCAKDMMTIIIEFNRVFNGVIYSKGYYNMPECRYVNENSGQIKYTFTVNLNMCGTEFVNAFDSEGKSYLENVLVLQNEAGIQEVWDTIRSVRCLWEGNLKEQLSASLMVGMLTQEIVTFSGDTAMAKLDILLGRGPLGQPANGLVKIGEPMTLVVSISGDPGFDVQVKDCRAIDSSGSNSLDLTDDDGCILKPKLFGAFQKSRQTGDSGASIIAYAYFNAFKFPDIMDIMIECNIELCKTDCEMCPDTDQALEPARRRRRRDISPFNVTLHDGVSMGKHIRVVLAEDLAPTAHYVDEGICMSTQNLLISSCLMISLLTASCFISAYMWLKTQRMRFKY